MAANKSFGLSGWMLIQRWARIRINTVSAMSSTPSPSKHRVHEAKC